MSLPNQEQHRLGSIQTPKNEPSLSYQEIVRHDRLSRLERILAYFGGAYIPVLRLNISDKGKYVRIGLFVFITALLAWVTMTFALHSIFFNEGAWYRMLPFSLIWACIIFVVDWGLVATMRKSETTSWQSWNTYTSLVIPTFLRIMVAGLISFTISKPLEVKLFESRLGPTISELKANRLQKKVNALKAEAKKLDYLPKIDSSINALITAQKEIPESAHTYDIQIAQNDGYIKDKQSEKSKLEDQCSSLLRQSYGNICIKRDEDGNCTGYEKGWFSEGAKASYVQKKRQIGVLKSEISQISTNIISLTEGRQNAINVYQNPIIAQINDQRNERGYAAGEQSKQDAANSINMEEMRKAYNESYDKNYLMVQIDALETLANDKEEGGFVFWVKWLIFAIIFVIDLMPIFIKLLSHYGPYERAIEDLESEKNLESRLRRTILRLEQRANSGLVHKLARHQGEIIRQSLNNWRDQRLQDLQEQPEEASSFFNDDHSGQ